MRVVESTELHRTRLAKLGVRAVLLDLDGTLVDRDAALRTWLRRRAGMGSELDRLLALDRDDHGELVQLSIELDRLRPGLGPNPRALVERIRRELPRLIEPDPRVARGLARLVAAGMKLAVISNGGPTQRDKLAAAKLSLGLFASVQISGELGSAKPSPAIFEAALRRLGHGPAESIMIGDSPDDDIVGASRLGIRTCFVARGRAYPSDRVAPTFVVEDLPAAVEWLLGPG